MFRLLNSEGLDLMTLARNARTSVEMIDRFYASHLTPEMKVTELQSLKNTRKTGSKRSVQGKDGSAGAVVVQLRLRPSATQKRG
jgi:hypothetical protein